ncbi:MAG: UDP-N-acetylmuramate dehydrogenase [Anaerolineaceae bacterium]|nr:UDP-N-acetylmuramate dehydrogenase [Anaerolineaceae bacterium]
MLKMSQQGIDILQNKYGKRLLQQVLLKNYSTARVGGNATWFISVKNVIELSDVIQTCWEHDQNYFLLGSGSNILFSDSGFEGLVILNHAKNIMINIVDETPMIQAESGANLGLVARKAALAGLSGLEWASTIPGTIGGAVFGNAGAHDGDMNSNLLLAEILQHDTGKSVWKNNDFEFRYRSSILKRQPGKRVILSASLNCRYDDPEKIKERMNAFSNYRRQTQPPGASMGSMFKNPPGDYAGRLIEAAGLKGFKIGGVKVSEVHANFFVNDENATAMDIYQLVQHVDKTVKQKFDVQLAVEVEMVGFNQMSENYTADHGEASI